MARIGTMLVFNCIIVILFFPFLYVQIYSIDLYYLLPEMCENIPACPKRRTGQLPFHFAIENHLY
jgi:hypothetical protein